MAGQGLRPKGIKLWKTTPLQLPAKSLVIFVAVGVAAGLALGAYLIDARQEGQPAFVEGPSLSVVTEKSDFKRGEQIRIRIVNSGTVPLEFPDASYGLRITGLSGMLMYAPVSAQVASGLEPRDEVEFVWDQVKNDGDPVLEGLYKIHSGGSDPQGNAVERSVTVAVWK